MVSEPARDSKHPVMAPVVTVLALMLAASALPAAANSPPGPDDLLEAARDGRAERVDRLLEEHGLDPSGRDRFGSTALMYAAWGGDTETVRRLLEAGADVGARNRVGVTALMDAVLGRHPGVVRLLLEHGADPTARDRYGRSVFERALMEPHPAILRTLDELRVEDVNVTRELGDDLIRAARNRNVERVTRLLASGVDPNVRSPKGHTPLIIAALQESPELARIILEKGGDTDARLLEGRSRGLTALHFAAFRGAVEIMQQLVGRGTDPDVPAAEGPLEGMTPLMVAVRNEQTPSVEWLIERGASVNISDRAGRTPLLLAVRRGDLPTVKTLVDAGASVQPPRPDAPDPLRVARDQKHWDLYRYLQSHVPDTPGTQTSEPARD